MRNPVQQILPLIRRSSSGCRTALDFWRAFLWCDWPSSCVEPTSSLSQQQNVRYHEKNIFLRVFYHSTAKIIHLIHFTNFSTAGRTFFSIFFSADRIPRSLLDNFTAAKKNSKCRWQKKSQKHKFSEFPASARPVIKFNLSRVNDDDDDVVVGASVMSWFLDFLIQFSQECRRHDASGSVIQSELVSREVSTFSFTSEKLLHNKDEDFVASKYRNRNRWRRLYICNFLRNDKIMRAVISRWYLNLLLL